MVDLLKASKPLYHPIPHTYSVTQQSLNLSLFMCLPLPIAVYCCLLLPTSAYLCLLLPIAAYWVLRTVTVTVDTVTKK